MAKPALDYLLSFLKNLFCCLFPHEMVLIHCKCSRASPCSSTVLISPWQMIRLCFLPTSSRFQVLLDTGANKSKLWPTLCCQRDWEKHNSINCGTTWLPLIPVVIEVPAWPVQQVSEVVWLHSGHNSLLSAFILHWTFTLAKWGC